jgi:hypothetical protein
MHNPVPNIMKRKANEWNIIAKVIVLILPVLFKYNIPIITNAKRASSD